MDVEAVPAALRERLGPQGTNGLLRLLEHTRDEWRDHVIAACTERFERRLVEEIAGVRVQIAQLDAALRQEIATMGAGLRQELAESSASLRQELAESSASLRQELAESSASLRQELAESSAGLRQEIAASSAGLRMEMATGRVELFKWCFLFWIGQVLAISAIVGVMMRAFRP